MPFSRILVARACSLVAILVFIFSSNLWAIAGPSLVASENPVNFYYSGDPLSLQPRTVAISLGGNAVAVTAATFTTNPDNPWNHQQIFEAAAAGTNVQIGVNLGATPSLPEAVYTGTLHIEAGGSTIDLPVRLTMGASAFTLTPASLLFQAAPGSTMPLSQTITISNTAAETFSATATTDVGGTWLAITPTGGTTVSGTTIQVTVSAAALTIGTYTGAVKVTIGNTQRTTSVTFQVGGSGGLSFNPGSLAYSYSTTVQQIPAAQQLTITSGTATQFSATPSSGGWLLIDGSAGTVSKTVPGSVNVSVNPTGLAGGVHQGIIYVQGNDGSYGTVNVTLAIDSSSSLVTVSPTSLSFTGTAPSGQQIAISTSTAGVNWTASSSQPWLSVSEASGTAPATLYAYVNSTGLSNTVYTGYIQLSFSGATTGSQQVYVSYAPGGGGGTTGPTAAVPSSVVFSMEKGKTTALPAQEVAVTGTAGTTFTVAAGSATGGNWLAATASAGQVPAKVTIAVNPTVASTLDAGQYSGTVAINSATGAVNVGVTLNVKNDPVLIPNPSSLTFYYDPASGVAPGGQVTLTSSSPDIQQFSYGATSSAPWVTLFSPTGTTPGTVPVAIDVSGLQPGVSAATISIAAMGAANTPVTVPVTIVVPGTPQGAIATPASLSFTVAAGQTSMPQNLSITSTGNVIFSLSSSVNWLTLNPMSGYTPGVVEVTANAAGLAVGTHNGAITVYAGGVTQQVPVSLTISSATPVTLGVDTPSGPFQYQQGGAVPAAKTIGVSTSGGTLSFQATANSTGNWLQVSPASGSTPATLSITVSPAGLAPGTYNGTIRVTAPGATNSPQTRNVTLTVTAAPTLAASPTTLTFNHRTDGSVPAAQTVAVTSTDGSLPFSATSNATWLQVSPATGVTPGNLSVSVNPTGLSAGSYTGRISITSSAAPGAAVEVEVRLTVTAPLPTIGSVANAASYEAGSAAPGEIVVLFGSFLGPNQLLTHQLDSSGRMATTLGDVRVLFNGLAAPLVYVSANQVSAIVPYATAGRQVNSVWLEHRGVRSNAVSVNGAAARPGIFTADASGRGPGAILNQDYSLNTAANAAARGSVVMLYVTGEGQTIPVGVDGYVNNDPNHLPKPVLPVTVTIGGQQATVLYGGAAPRMVSGLMQVNVEVPANAPVGAAVPVVVNVGGAASQQGVTMAIR